MATRRHLEDQPSHPSVDWRTLADRPSGKVVSVTCPVCGQVAVRRAREVRWRIKRGLMTGLCRRDCRRQVKKLREAPPPEHSLVDWGTLAPSPSGPRVQVVCPICREPRMLEAKTVRAQLRRGSFKGHCIKDAGVGRAPRNGATLPSHPNVDWNDFEFVLTSDGRRRSRTRVICPVCGNVALYDRLRLARLVEQGFFEARCETHRRRSTTEPTSRSHPASE